MRHTCLPYPSLLLSWRKMENPRNEGEDTGKNFFFLWIVLKIWSKISILHSKYQKGGENDAPFCIPRENLEFQLIFAPNQPYKDVHPNPNPSYTRFANDSLVLSVCKLQLTISLSFFAISEIYPQKFFQTIKKLFYLCKNFKSSEL